MEMSASARTYRVRGRTNSDCGKHPKRGGEYPVQRPRIRHQQNTPMKSPCARRWQFVVEAIGFGLLAAALAYLSRHL